MVLLRKEGRPVAEPSAYRPIVFLDEVGKLFERILFTRIVKHLEESGRDLSDHQFGFRKGRSTLDAVSRVRAIAEASMSQGGMVVAVSLDIANAFNALSWETILEAMRFHTVPGYLRRIVGDYLCDRAVCYPAGEEWRRK